VHDHAGCVEDAAQCGAPRRFELGLQQSRQIAWLNSGADLLTGSRQHCARCVDREWVVHRARELIHGREVSELHVFTILRIATPAESVASLPR
jgi:hypothetical protein